MLLSWELVSFTVLVMAKCAIYINLACFLSTANVGGVFLVLGFGCLFALIVAIIEFLWNVKKVAVEERVGWIVVDGMGGFFIKFILF